MQFENLGWFECKKNAQPVETDWAGNEWGNILKYR